MLLWIISLLTLAAAAADVIHYRRMRRRAPGVRHRVFIVAAAATDALPAVIAVAGAVARDNTTAFMTFAMWAFWVWMITVLPRIACYFFRLVGLPRAGKSTYGVVDVTETDIVCFINELDNRRK